MSGSEVIIMGYCPTCNAPYYAQGHSREDMLRAQLAAALAERDAARRELAEIKGRRCETCRHWHKYLCEDGLSHVIFAERDFYCAAWAARDGSR